MRELKLLLLLLTSCACARVAVAQSDAAIAGSLSVNASAHSPANIGDTGRAAPRRNDERYRLCASDVIALTFPLTPEFDQTVSVQPDGYVTLAGAGDIHIEGLTTQESTDAIRIAYSKILHEPIVSVELKDFNKPYFTVTGQVNRPGKYDLRGETSAAEAVAIAGGFNDAARHSQVLLFRRLDNNWYEVKPLNLKRVLQGQDVNEDPEIHPGDMLFVPQNFISKVRRFIPSSGIGAYYQLHP